MLMLLLYYSTLPQQSGQWTDIESDPGVFTELVERFGVINPSLQFEELWSADPDSLRALGDLIGVLFLFKWTKDPDARRMLSAEECADKGIFFANQVIQNACATQAILHIILNNGGIDPGPALSEFRDFVACFPPDTKGEALAESAVLREAHNAFALPDAGMWRDHRDKDDTKGEAFHFIAYVPHRDGTLLELDGLKPGPIPLGSFAPGTDAWIDVLSGAIQERIARYAGAELRFNLMAVVRDRRETLRAQLRDLEARRDAALAQGASGAPVQGEIEVVEQSLLVEEEKRATWRNENIRRRHNYLPFIIEMLKAAGEQGRLVQLYDKTEAAKNSSKASAKA